jgi:VWFA-related protein
MKLFIRAIVLAALPISASLLEQSPATNSADPQRALRTYSRAVLIDVLVTDRRGKPVTGLKQDQFTVTEQGKPQAITYFEEHSATQPPPVAMPKLPPNVFTNFSPYPLPPAVNVLLLDSLNTRMENQGFVHKQALAFLRSAKPGSRMAIFTMSLNLRFIQGFTDDPELLASALGNAKNNEVQSVGAMKTADETLVQKTIVQMGAGALKQFFEENDDSRAVDRGLITLAHLQRLATFLNTFPGRKNVIWFTEGVPWIISGQLNQQLDEELNKTMNMLAAARIALYPVDARGVSTTSLYQSDNVLPATTSGFSEIIEAQTNDTGAENRQRDSDQLMLEKLAHDTGGKAFVNSNGLAQIVADITSSSGDFYTLSYAPTNSKIDGVYRKISLKISGGDYNLSYRRGYYATSGDEPGSHETGNMAKSKRTLPQSASGNPLEPFMDPGMPQIQQILYEARIRQLATKDKTPHSATDSGKNHQNIYSVDFAVDRKDLNLEREADGNYKDKLNLSLIAYDRYGHIVGGNDQSISLNLEPDTYALFGNVGVQVHAEIAVPKGQLWLRTGIYDQGSRKVGTMEIPLGSITATDTSAK